MAKSDQEREPEDMEELPPPAVAWGTWEELLLAYAVNRHGTKSWDSISSELRKRSSAPILLTPHHCQQKYRELKRRFNDDDVEMDDGSDTTIPWLDELRNLRVLELQRQLQNYDLSISSLQLKVKKLTEESEKNGGETKKKSDLGHRNEEIELKKAEEEVKNDTPELAVSGNEYSDRDNQSANGSNGNLETGVEKSENENENDKNVNEASPVGTGDEKPESAALSPVREEDSCNGRPEGKEAAKTQPDGEATESIAESKSEGTMKENSDVQSSASKSRKERVDRVRRGTSKGDERENEDQSTDSIPVRSLPLVDFLHKLHKLASPVFDRRLDRQEKLRYKNLIRQHIDYEILQTRLKEGWYSDGNDKFFRDLLLLVNNTRVFFPKESTEFSVAGDLRQFIHKEMTSKKKLKTDSKLTSSKPTTVPPKRGSEPADSLLLKPKLAGPIVVCRKRSSITAKASGSSSGADRRKEQADLKNSEKSNSENRDTTPKRSRDSFSSMTKKKGKNVRGGTTSENQDERKTSNETSETKSDKKKKLTEAEEKKQSAAKFLNRMKGTAAGGGSENDSKGVQKRGSGNKGGGNGGDGKKEQAAKKNSGGRQVKEQGSPAKRSVGRPPKRAAAPSPMTGKRTRESVESETLGSKQTKKRSKR